MSRTKKRPPRPQFPPPAARPQAAEVARYLRPQGPPAPRPPVHAPDRGLLARELLGGRVRRHGE